MCNSQSSHDLLSYICLLFSSFSNACYSACVWPTVLQCGCISNFDVLFFVIEFNSLVHEFYANLQSPFSNRVYSIQCALCYFCVVAFVRVVEFKAGRLEFLCHDCSQPHICPVVPAWCSWTFLFLHGILFVLVNLEPYYRFYKYTNFSIS